MNAIAARIRLLLLPFLALLVAFGGTSMASVCHSDELTRVEASSAGDCCSLGAHSSCALSCAVPCQAYLANAGSLTPASCRRAALSPPNSSLLASEVLEPEPPPPRGA